MRLELTLLLVLAQQSSTGDSGLLSPGLPVSGEISATDEVVRTGVLDAAHEVPTVGRSYDLVVDASGTYSVELRSYFFDAYLILRDAAGVVLAEDDDSLIGTHARISDVTLDSGVTYRVTVCALHGQRGPFELSLVPGESPVLSDLERADLLLADARRRLAAVEGQGAGAVIAASNSLADLLCSRAEYGEARALYERALEFQPVSDPELARRAETLNGLGLVLLNEGDFTAARQHFERALTLCEEVFGPEDAATATTLNNLALLFYEQGQYSTAEPLYQRALEIRERVLGAEHADVAASLSNLGLLLKSQGDYEAASSMYLRALEVVEKAVGSDDPLTAQTLNNYAELLRARGKLAAARPVLERVLSIYEKKRGEAHPRTGLSLNNLATLLSTLGEYETARGMYERAIAALEASLGPNHPQTARVVRNLAGLLMAVGEFTEAKVLQERVLSIHETALGPDHPVTAATLDSLAALLASRGELESATALRERALAIRNRTAGSAHPQTAMSMLGLAESQLLLGELAEARRLAERALEILTETSGPGHVATAKASSTLAQVMQAIGDQAAARPLFERALEVYETELGPSHPSTATGRNDLATSLIGLGEFAEAKQLLEDALSVYVGMFGDQHPHVVTTRNNLAVLLEALGDSAGAEAAYRAAVQFNEDRFGPLHPRTAAGLNNLATFLSSQGEFTQAAGFAERAFGICADALGSEHPRTAQTLCSLAQLKLVTGQAEEALQLLSQTESGHRRQLAGVLQSLSAAESIQYLFSRRWQLELRLSIEAEDHPAGGEQAYHELLQWKGAVSRALVSSREQLCDELSAEQRSLLERLRDKQKALSRTLFTEQPQERADYLERIAELQDERNALEVELRRTLTDSSSATPVSGIAIAAALPPRAAVVDFFLHRVFEENADGSFSWSQMRISAWVTRYDARTVARLSIGPAAPIEKRVKNYLAHLLEDEDGGDRECGKALTQLLWQPIAEHLGGIEQVIVSPDSFLGTIPFEVLPSAGGGFLIEDYSFIYRQDVLTLLSERRATTPPRGSLLAMGAVDYAKRADWDPDEAGVVGGSRGMHRGAFPAVWRALPYTDWETQAVVALHEAHHGEEASRTVLTGSGATEERLKYEAQRHAVLHLATHGFFQPDGVPSLWERVQASEQLPATAQREIQASLVGKHPGLLSGLVCAGANIAAGTGRDDGYLTAEEVTWLDLSGVELVVLSACETGLGRAQSGEGLIGLRRGFRTAGARTVISSLWAVQDKSTSRLMSAFYRNLWDRGMSRHGALRAAQLELISGRLAPSQWGAFVLSGDWR